jgi:hypothetical protein
MFWSTRRFTYTVFLNDKIVRLKATIFRLGDSRCKTGFSYLQESAKTVGGLHFFTEVVALRLMDKKLFWFERK